MRYVAVFFQRAEPADGPGARGALQKSGACLRRQDQGQRIVTFLAHRHVSDIDDVAVFAGGCRRLEQQVLLPRCHHTARHQEPNHW